MSVNAMPAQGTLIKIGSGSPVSYATIGEVKSFNGPGGSAAVIDVTDLSSTAKEKRMGLQDEGQVTLNLNFLPSDTQHALLRTAKASGAATPFQIVFEDSTTWSFTAFVLSVVLQGAVDAVVEGSVTLEISGSISES